MAKVKKEGQGQLFGNPLLEIFTKTNPVIHVLTYGGVIGLFFYMNEKPLSAYFLMIFVGVFIWTFTEYALHRFLFHIKESRFQYTIHGVHHEYPRDKERLMMPPLPGLIIITLFYGFFWLLFRSNTPLFMVGFVSGYLAYTFIHYIVHTWKPVKGMKFLWTHHHKHHNPIHENKAFGVSSPLWDYILGTMPSKNPKQQ